MPSRFVSLAAYLHPPAAPAASEVPTEMEHAGPPSISDALVTECAMFRARLREAFERQSEALLADLAADVLARELRLAPVETGAIVARLIETFSSETPVAVRVHPEDVASIHVDLPLETDAALRRGDAILVVRDGTLESTLGVRLDALVRAAAPR